jgi:hypothetical protein
VQRTTIAESLGLRFDASKTSGTSSSTSQKKG